MSTTLMSFRPDSHLASRLEKLTILTGRSKTYYLKEALRVSLDAFEKEAFEQAKSRKEMKMSNDDEDMTQRLVRLETAQAGCGLMALIRRSWIRDEKRKKFPDQELIRQWEEEEKQFTREQINLRLSDVEGQERIFREYSPQVKAYFQQLQQPAAVEQEPSEVESVRAAA